VQVAVIGPHDATDEERAAAYEVGGGLGEAGVVVVTGGRGGVMAAATAGARDAGGTTLALLPGEDRRASEVPATVVVPTGLGEARNALVVRSADAVIAIGGAWGTLSELALALRRGTPVIGLGTWALADDLAARGLADPVVRAASPAVAVRAVVGILGLGDET
jgi:uncharacterized protein (TIGR00725 family)